MPRTACPKPFRTGYRTGPQAARPCPFMPVQAHYLWIFTTKYVMKKNYNYKRRKLYLPEYGRHIQEMVDTLLLIEDRVERTRQAKAVIAVMGNLNPLLRDTADFTHKLWDHLFIMSDFQLDVDSPYPLPTRKEIMVSPRKMHYSQSYIRFKHYGKYIGRMLKCMGEHPASPETAKEVGNVFRFMRAKSYEYNHEHPNNEVIIKDLKQLSDYRIEVDEVALNNFRNDYKQFHSPYQQQNRNQKRPMQKGRNQQRPMQKGYAKGMQRHNTSK